MRKNILFITVAAVVVIFDQITKLILIARLPVGQRLPIIDGLFDLVHVRNTGVAFGIFSRSAFAYRAIFFLAASLIAMTIIVLFLRKLRQDQTGWIVGLGLVFGGAIGNLIDRVRLGEVIDFADFYVGNFHWPAFNVADSAVTIGALYLMIRIIRKT